VRDAPAARLRRTPELLSIRPARRFAAASRPRSTRPSSPAACSLYRTPFTTGVRHDGTGSAPRQSPCTPVRGAGSIPLIVVHVREFTTYASGTSWCGVGATRDPADAGSTGAAAEPPSAASSRPQAGARRASAGRSRTSGAAPDEPLHPSRSLGVARSAIRRPPAVLTTSQGCWRLPNLDSMHREPNLGVGPSSSNSPDNRVIHQPDPG
jgi:hypothetical protein